MPDRPAESGPKGPIATARAKFARAHTAARGRLRDAWHSPHRWRHKWPFALAGIVAVLAVVIAFWDWNILKGPIERYASAATGRSVAIGGDVDVDLDWTTRVTLNRVSIANPEWAQGDMARVGRIQLDVQLWPLLASGAAILPQVEVDQPTADLVRLKDGRANWRFGEDGSGGEMKLPVIGRMLVIGGRVHVNDMRHAMVFDGTMESREGPHGEAQRAFVLKGNGTLDRKPFTATMTGDSPLRADRTHPYAFVAHLAMGTSVASASGTLPRPFDLDEIEGHIDLSGPDMADLYLVTGLVFPNTPPYRLHARVTRNGDVWAFNAMGGLVGHTDLAGKMGVDSTGDRPLLTADLTSRKADIDDITTLFGAPPETHAVPSVAAAAPVHANGAPATAPAAPKPEPEHSFVQSTIGLLPDAPLDVKRVRNMDARVHYTAAVIATGGVPMRDLAVTVKLDHGLLTVAPASVKLALGNLSGRARLDARKDIPDVDLSLHLTQAKLEEFFHPAAGGTKPLEGVLEATANLHGHGLSVRTAVANANGDIGLAVPHGQIRKSLAELLGINLLNGLGLMIADDQSTTPLRCAVADFHADNGTLTVRRFVLDTQPVLAVGTGHADLRNETLDVTLEGHPKSFRLGRVMAPITITGKLVHPKIGIEAGKAVAQSGIAVALGAALTPLAAVIPFIATGTAKDVDCTSLLAGGPPPASD